ncbi:MAG: PilZ domain-containing protein [Desulfobulbaceae bacterium]|uniref:PilZ domain-containing protein n=1 Tax=Candidatus Desulfatifera sulfidica TaxID=2841691 RepID=A0A8J6TCT2_9BACT|nr:PilZ domain-containing protein [Candidatus Desulfatifera sulfidica]
MKKEEDVEIEFEDETVEEILLEGDDNVSNLIVRDDFRVSVDDSYGVNVCVGSHRYDVVNISKGGVAIRLSKGEKPFAMGEVLSPIELALPDRVLTLRGKVCYVSYDGQECPICGLSFAELDEESALQILEFYQYLRKEMFSKS